MDGPQTMTARQLKEYLAKNRNDTGLQERVLIFLNPESVAYRIDRIFSHGLGVKAENGRGTELKIEDNDTIYVDAEPSPTQVAICTIVLAALVGALIGLVAKRFFGLTGNYVNVFIAGAVLLADLGICKSDLFIYPRSVQREALLAWLIIVLGVAFFPMTRTGQLPLWLTGQDGTAAMAVAVSLTFGSIVEIALFDRFKRHFVRAAFLDTLAVLPYIFFMTTLVK